MTTRYFIVDRALLGAKAIGLLKGMLDHSSILDPVRHKLTRELVQEVAAEWDEIKRKESAVDDLRAEDVIERARRGHA